MDAALGIATEIFFGRSQKNWSEKPGNSKGVATPNKECESGEWVRNDSEEKIKLVIIKWAFFNIEQETRNLKF